MVLYPVVSRMFGLEWVSLMVLYPVVSRMFGREWMSSAVLYPVVSHIFGLEWVSLNAVVPSGFTHVWPWVSEFSGVIPSRFTLSHFTIFPDKSIIIPKNSFNPLSKAILYLFRRGMVRNFGNCWSTKIACCLLFFRSLVVTDLGWRSDIHVHWRGEQKARLAWPSGHSAGQTVQHKGTEKLWIHARGQ